MRRTVTASAFLLMVLLKGECQAPPAPSDFPLDIRISQVQDMTAAFPVADAVKGAQLGMAPEGFILFRGSINGDSHWLMQCRPEVLGRESVPCTTIPKGEYKGRWIHDHINLQLMGGPNDSMTRFLIVSADPKNPPAPHATPPLAPIYGFSVVYPNGKAASDYPIFIHVYGSVSQSFAVGQIPAQSSCSAQSWTPYQTTLNCTTRPAREIDRGYVTVDFSASVTMYASMDCWAKWRWSHCSALEPGFYYARPDKNRMIVLTHDGKGNPKEIGFEPHIPNDPALQSPMK
jgi:hypothetical protein